MTTLPQRRFGDPLDVLLKAEAETCKGCKHRVVSHELNDYDLRPKVGCKNPSKQGKLLYADKRCDEYEEATS